MGTTTTLTSKGQITIPAKLRAELGLKQGDELIFEVDAKKKRFIVSKRKKYDVSELCGIVPRPKRAISIKEMNEAIMDAAVERYERSFRD